MHNINNSHRTCT
uniref:Uncharacterized protein n=1 Tax=Arundo donax TaxID=35708 RepID=A0A0A9BAV6_ARUDO